MSKKVFTKDNISFVIEEIKRGSSDADICQILELKNLTWFYSFARMTREGIKKETDPFLLERISLNYLQRTQTTNLKRQRAKLGQYTPRPRRKAKPKSLFQKFIGIFRRKK